MLVRSQEISIGNIVFPFFHEVAINSTWKNLCDTGSIRMPRRYNSILVGGKKVVLDKVVKSGDEVEVKLGYDSKIETRFKGFLKSIKPSYPIEMEVEDAMYTWKRTKVAPKAFRGGNVKEILKYLGLKDYKVYGDSLTIGDFYISEEMNTVARVLEKLKEASGMPVFMRKGMVHVGAQYELDPKKRRKHIYIIGKNVISHDLECKQKEDNPIEVEVISKQLDGREIKVKVGDSKAKIKHTKHVFGMTDRTAMQSIGLAEIDKVSYTGWMGKLTVFGNNIVEHGDVVELYDMDEGLIEGSYFIDSVDIKVSASTAYIQELELGQIVR